MIYCHPWAIALDTINLPTKCELYTDYEDIKTIQDIENRVVLGNLGSCKVTENSAFDRAHARSYQRSTVSLSCTVSEI